MTPDPVEFIGVDLPDDFQLQVAVDGMIKAAEELDARLLGETETDEQG